MESSPACYLCANPRRPTLEREYTGTTYPEGRRGSPKHHQYTVTVCEPCNGYLDREKRANEPRPTKIIPPFVPADDYISM